MGDGDQYFIIINGFFLIYFLENYKVEFNFV